MMLAGLPIETSYLSRRKTPGTWQISAKKGSRYGVQLAIPRLVSKNSLEYLIAQVSGRVREATNGAQTTAAVTAFRLVLSADLSRSLLAEIAAFREKMDAGQLDRLINRAPLQGVVKPATLSEMEVLERLGIELGDALRIPGGAAAEGEESDEDLGVAGDATCRPDDCTVSPPPASSGAPRTLWRRRGGRSQPKTLSSKG